MGESEAFVRGVRDGKTVTAALLVGVASLGVVLVCRHWWPRVPGILIAVVGAAIATGTFDLTEHGVSVVGRIPSGFPTPALPDVNLHDIGTLLLAAAGMAFVTLADTTAVSRSLAAKRGEHVDANQEIVALGTANATAGFFQGFPVSASATRTAVAESAGSGTQAAGVVGAVAIIVILMADGGLGQNLPQSTLAAIVIAAAFLLFDVTSLRWFWRVRRSELYLSVAALLGVAILGVLQGIGVAIVLSLGDFIRRAWRPYDAVLGRVPGRKGYHDIDRHPDAAQIPGLVLYRFDAPLFFANAEVFADRLAAAMQSTGRPDALGDRRRGADDRCRLDRGGHPRVDSSTTSSATGSSWRSRSSRVRSRTGSATTGSTTASATIISSRRSALRSDGYLAATGTVWVDWSDAGRQRAARSGAVARSAKPALTRCSACEDDLQCAGLGRAREHVVGLSNSSRRKWCVANWLASS